MQAVAPLMEGEGDIVLFCTHKSEAKYAERQAGGRRDPTTFLALFVNNNNNVEISAQDERFILCPTFFDATYS